MINSLAESLAQRIKRAVPNHPVSVDVMAFSLSVLINTFSIILLSMIVGIFTGELKNVVIVLISFASLRQISGGFHLKSGILCVAVSVTGVTLLSLVELSYYEILWASVASGILILIFAPSRIEKQTRIPRKYFPMLKVASLFLISLNVAIGSSAIAAAFLVQSITLIRGRG